MLSIRGLIAELGDFALDISLEAPSDRTVALVGPSGAGKTSLLRCIAGLVEPSAGSIRCGGEAWFDAEDASWLAPERRRCGYVFQDYALFPHRTASQNVEFALRGAGPRSERRAKALELLDRFGLSHRAAARPRTLSGGERQRVALARALAVEPTVLLLDEPLSALDATTRAHSARELAAIIAEVRVPTLVVTHDFEEAATLADEVGVIADGRLVQRGTAAELASAPGSAFVADLVGSVVLSGMAGSGDGRIDLDGGGVIWTTEAIEAGRVTVSVHPWEVLIEPAASAASGSARNRVAARVASVTPLGNRVRVGLDAGQPLAAEVTPQSVDELGLAPGREVMAVWKASATKVVER